MARLVALCLAVAATFLSAPAARAQDLYGAYCGEVTWAGQAPVDVWILFRTENRWSAPSSVGPFVGGAEGTYTQNGTMITMRGNEAPNYTIAGSAAGGRIVGEVTANDGRRGIVSLTQMQGSGATVASAPVPPDYVLEDGEQAAQGNMQGLNRAFVWAWTAQGSAYWRGIRDSGVIPPAAIETIRDWNRRARAGEQPRCIAQ